jgi:hypothetical protein
MPVGEKLGTTPEISSFGRIQDKCGARYFVKPNPYGRRSVAFDGLGPHHVGLFVLVYHKDPELLTWAPGKTVDHNDQNPLHDHVGNLSFEYYHEQNINRTLTEDGKQNYRIARGHAVQGQMCNLDGSWTKWQTWDAKKQAARVAKVCDRSVHNSIEKGSPVTSNVTGREWRFRMLQQVDTDGVTWTHLPDVEGIEIDLKHGLFKRNGCGMTKGTKSGMYRKTQIDGHARSVHEILGTLLYGERPSDEHTMEHRNKELDEDGCLSNAADNLVGWFNKIEQRATQGNGSKMQTLAKKIYARRKSDSKLFGPYNDASEAAEALEISRSMISMVCIGLSISKKYEFWYEPQPDIVQVTCKTMVGPDGRVSFSAVPDTEKWAVVHAEDWQPGGKYHKILEDFKADGRGKRLPSLGSDRKNKLPRYV